jgi:catechol 2,3-dioxygenase-like lactoylglutathione lyase family enzyme
MCGAAATLSPTAGFWKSDHVIDHVAIQAADVPASAAFYDAVLGALGGRRLMEVPRPGGDVIGYGVDRPTFWVGPLTTADGAREAHLAFAAADRAAVVAFYDAAVVAGAAVLHEPRPWPEYHAGYFGAFVRDPDGNNVEAVCHRPE